MDSSLLDRSARRTNAQGACSWSELETGVWEVVPERGSPAQVTVSAGKGASVEIRVPAGVAIQVGVLDVRGHAVPRASILVSEPGSLSGWRTVGQSDEAGRIELVGMDPRSWVAARADGFRPAQARLVGDSDAVGLVFLVLHESRAFQGRVLDEAGDPVVGARLEVMRELESGIWIERTGELSASWERSSARTDALGRFELDGVLQRELDLRIEAAGFEESVESIHLIVTRFAPMDFTLVRRQEPAPRFEWGGVVRGADGLPLSGALVFARPRLGVNRSPLCCLADAPDTRRIVTDEHGRFTFEDSSARPQDLWVVDRGGVSRFPCAHLAAAPSSSSVEIVSVGEPQGVLSGILDPNLAGEILLMLGSRALIGPIELPVDPDTRAFRVEGLPAADYSLALFFQGELYRDALRFQLASGAHLELGRVTLPALGRVRIQVLREDDASLEGTWAALVGERGITLRVRYGATARGAAYGRDGFLTFDGLPCGPHTIHFGGQGLAQSACLVDVRPGVPETVAMTVGAGVAVLFELRDPGEPLGSVVLDLVDATDRMVARHSVDSRADEALIMLRLAPGPYRVIVRRESGRTTEHPVVVPASQGERLVIDFGHGQGSGSSTR